MVLSEPGPSTFYEGLSGMELVENDKEKTYNCDEIFENELVEKCFPTREDLVKHVKKFAFAHGFAASIKRSCNKKKQVLLGCDRGGTYRKWRNMKDDERKRKISSRLVNCPFEVKGRQIDDGSWKLTTKNLEHNHEMSNDLTSHPRKVKEGIVSDSGGMAATAAAAKPVIKVAALCGSLRKASCHRGIIRSAIQLCNESIKEMQIEYVDIEPLPFLNTDLESGSSFPAPVEAFRKKILEADSILFASPEYNYSVTGPLKNAIDWASRAPNVWADKPAAIVSTGGSFGGGRAQYHLRQIGVYLDLHFINKPELYIFEFRPPKKFDNDGNLIDPESKERLKELLLSLQAFTLRFQGKC